MYYINELINLLMIFLLMLISIIDIKIKNVYILMPIIGILSLIFISSLETVVFALLIFIVFSVTSLITPKLGKGDALVFTFAAFILNSPDKAFNMIFLTFIFALIYSLFLKMKGINRFIALCPFMFISTVLVKVV